MRKSRWLLGTATFVVLAIIWQVLASLGITALKYLPTPLAVIEGGAGLMSTGTFWGAITHTVLVALGGWLVACAIGLVFGTLIGLSRTVQDWTLTSIDAFRAIPVIAILPVMVLLVGLTTQMELYLVIYAAVWPVLINTIGGLANVSRALRDTSSTLRLSRLSTIAKVFLPSAAAPISVGISIALTLSLVIAVLAEIIANPAGVGHEIQLSQSALRPDLMFAYIAVTGILGLLLSFGLQGLYRLLRPGLLSRGGLER